MKPVQHQLRCEGFVSPYWFNGRWSDRRTRVLADGSIEMNSNRLVFVSNPLPPGTEVEVQVGRQFYCETVEDVEAYRQELRAKEQAEQATRRQRSNERRARAEAFNATIKLPVRWQVAIKDVLSGLSANSNGDGRNRATVEHIRLLEDLREGKLQRSAGAFLCTPAKGNYSNQAPELHTDGNGREYQPAVTCRACLKVAKRWIADPAEAAQD